MLNLDPYLLLVAVGVLYVTVFTILGLTRREGLSDQFILESIGLSVLLIGGSWLLGWPLNPFLYLAILYLVTMRSRLIVDLANLLARRGKHEQAFRLYRLGLAWKPDAASRLVVLSNLGAAQLHRGDLRAAIATLEGVLAEENRPRLGAKYEAACHYNLGYAYEQNGQDAQSVAQYNAAIEALPGSVYGRGAQAALKRRKARHGGS